MKPKFEEVEYEVKEDELEESAFSKIFFVIIGAIILLLVVSFVFVNFPIADIIAGKMESKIIVNNTINLGDFSIILENGAYETLQKIYFSNPKVEMSACLLGKKEGNYYLISDLYQPRVYSESFNEILFDICSNETLIILHSHPYKRCIASETDIGTLNKTKQTNPNVLMVVMCEAKRFSVYR